MNGKTAVVLLSGLLFACVPAQPPQVAATPAPPPTPAAAPTPVAASLPADRDVVIRRATCDALLGLSPEDRAAASMFYIGYQASRLRARTINVGAIPEMESLALSYCAERPDRPAAQAFAEAYREARR
jgi:hypothetical protein